MKFNFDLIMKIINYLWKFKRQLYLVVRIKTIDIVANHMQFKYEFDQSEKKSDGAGVWAQVSRATIWGTNHYTTPSLFEGLRPSTPLNAVRDGL